jgi:hypothetical protein
VPKHPDKELETRRIILLRVSRGGTPEILLGTQSAHHTLPQVQIARWGRVALQVTAAFQQMWGLDTLSLHSFRHPVADPDAEQVCYEVMEARGPEAQVPPSNRWTAVEALVGHRFQDRNDFDAVQRAIAHFVHSGEEPFYGPFARLGWFSELEQWTRDEIASRGLRLNGRFRQLTASPHFTLIRFETDGPAIWFKAVDVPNRSEYPLTLALARHFPRFLPAIIATRPEWNGWLALEAPGTLLADCPSITFWQSTARDLAELQIESLGSTEHMLECGARNLRTAAVASLAEPFFEAMGEVMELQTKTLPPPLSRAQLRGLATRVGGALNVLEEKGNRETLGHMDFNPGNIVCSAAGTVFLDWAEAFVGHPFLTFEYMREHLRRKFGHDESLEARVAASYTSMWRTLASEESVRFGFKVAPLAAVFACAVGNDLWRDPRKLQEPGTAGYLRSLTRRMERETRALAEWSMACPS